MNLPLTELFDLAEQAANLGIKAMTIEIKKDEGLPEMIDTGFMKITIKQI